MNIFNLFKKKPQVQEPEWIKLYPKEMAELVLNEIRTNPQVCNLDEIPHGVGEFGLEITNPIPTYGVPTNEIYLKKLCLQNGNKIRWRRDGSVQTISIAKTIDKYEIFNSDGDTVCFLFICPYHLKISEKAPRGFKFL